MNLLKKIISDTLYVSKVTKTKYKTVLLFGSVILSQLIAFIDIGIIAILSNLITNQFTSIEIINKILIYVSNNRFILLILVFLKFLFQYFQNMMLKRIEIAVNKNLKTYILNQIFHKRNYSVADSYFYINVLSTHISFFYSSFAQFLNSFLQIFAYLSYLLIADSKAVLSFGFIVLLLFYPIKKLLDKSRAFMHESYETGQESNREVQRVVDNLFLIKILKKEKFEISKFNKTLDEFNYNSLNNFRYGILNSILPTFVTLTLLSIAISYSNYSKTFTLDFIGIVLRLFQSVSMVITSLNRIINSHVHMEKFHEMENDNPLILKNSFTIQPVSKITVNDLSFKYFNSKDFLFEDLNFEIEKKSHVLIIGPNGSGKSTLVGLLAGVFIPEKGNIKTFSDKFGYIGPTPLIFQSSLYENLMYGNSGQFGEDEIIEQLIQLDTFKEKKEYDLQRNVDNKSLSSGQMQKIAFIRALLSNPEILFLDEAVSNIDSESREIIFEILKNKNITIINSTNDKEFYTTATHYLNIKILNEKRIVTLN